MDKKVKFSIVAFSSIIGIVVAFNSKQWPIFSTQAKDTKTQAVGVMNVVAEYTGFSEEELYASSDLVFVGQVVKFSPSFWNQDKNSYPKSVQEWESTPSHVYHQVTLRVTKNILGTKVGQLIDVTVFGPSPLKSKVKIGPGYTFYAESEDSSLKVGSKGVFLLNTYGKAAWMSSGRAIMKKMTMLSASTFQSYIREEKGSFLVGGKPAPLTLIESKVKLHASAREKHFRSLQQN